MQKPQAVRTEATPWTAAEVGAVADQLPYAHFMPDDDDRAREIMNAFFAPTGEGADRAPCALIVPGGRHE